MLYEQMASTRAPKAIGRGKRPAVAEAAPSRSRTWAPSPTAMLALQRSAGNRATVQAAAVMETPWVRPAPLSVQRSSTAQRSPSKALRKQLESKLPLLQANARLVESAASLGEAYVNLSVATTDVVSTKLQLYSMFYDTAYARYAAVIGKGRAEAQNQTLWRGIFLGIGTGVLAGLAAAYVAPSAAAGWLTLTLADAATAAGSSFLQAGASSAVAYAMSDAMTARGSDLQPGGLSPDMLRSNIWKHVAGMYRAAFSTTQVLSNLRHNSILLERTIAETRVHVAGGASAITPEEIVRAGDTMNARVAKMRTVFDGLNSSAVSMSNFSSTAQSYDPSKPTVDQMEDDIWIMWIGSLSDDDSDILDLDAIEDYLAVRGILGPNSRLGVDFEGWTTKEHELAALAAGRRQANGVRARYDQATARWNAK